MVIRSNIYDIGNTLSKYPRSTEKVSKWFEHHIYETMLLLAREARNEAAFKEQFNREEAYAGALPHFTYNARDLYEFFDENKIYIEGYEEKGRFGVLVNGDELVNYPNRWAMETAAFDRAFEILEGKF